MYVVYWFVLTFVGNAFLWIILFKDARVFYDDRKQQKCTFKLNWYLNLPVVPDVYMV